MFKGINFKEFLSTHEEWHALVFGFCEIVCPWRPMYKTMSGELFDQIVKEFHYYMTGRAFGIAAWIGIIALFMEIIT